MMVETVPFDAAPYLAEAEAQAALLNDAFASGKAAYVAHALGVIARARDMADVARAAGVTREALYRLLSEDGDPRLTTLLGVARALGETWSARIEARAEVKVETFAFKRCGMIDGTVSALSRDAVLQGTDARETPGQKGRGGEDAETPPAKGASYMVRIALDRNWIDTEAGRMTLGAGMSVTAEVFTGRRRIISFLLSPLQRMVGESGHER